ncbi:opine dehydrogenase [Desulfonispora thiosulfatigenes DSM 11270]|uniref:Opine dehydrogenase n=1 Tax=Desulfonispora thiosulfatigenes DSM 11270 TaxID=656914 RepID=A0A1W1VHI5_DESTI|nr:NAD/NADP octopine/nopaline dehydrogenase family protein [Desulfonispora thiosulfatigenes]SMB92798.1 opine dehydrogenase [Desulfonispora thiosulfatigenes DSM 11270]
MKVKSVAILGAGNGGGTAAADLTSRGFEVRLYESPEFSENLEETKRKGGILLKDDNGEQFVKPALVTTNLKEAISGAQVVMITVPTTVIKIIAKECIPLLEKDQVVVIHSAASLGSYRFMNLAKEMGITTQFKLGETNTLQYGTRFFADKAEVELGLRAKGVLVSALPSSDIDKVYDAWKQIYPTSVAAKNIFETTLNNGNPESHTGPGICNAGRIEYSKGEFYLYKEGITKSTVHMIKAVNSECRALCEAFGFEAKTKEDRIADLGYAPEYRGDLQRQYNSSPIYCNIKGPTSVTGRYFVEDISNGLTIWSSIGRAIGVKTPVIDAIITIGSTLLQHNFWEEGETLETIGLGGKGLNELVNLVK